MTKPSPDSEGPSYPTKKCPECYGYMPLAAQKCPFCKTPVKGVGKHGMAERHTNWKGYIISAVLWLALIIYIKYAFF